MKKALQTNQKTTLMCEDTVSISWTASASYHFHQLVKNTTADPHSHNTSRVHKFHSNVCSGNQFSDHYIKVQKRIKETLNSGMHVPSHLHQIMENVMLWHTMDNLNIDHLDFETNLFLGNTYISSGDELNNSLDEVIFPLVWFPCTSFFIWLLLNY